MRVQNELINVKLFLDLQNVSETCARQRKKKEKSLHSPIKEFRVFISGNLLPWRCARESSEIRRYFRKFRTHQSRSQSSSHEKRRKNERASPEGRILIRRQGRSLASGIHSLWSLLQFFFFSTFHTSLLLCKIFFQKLFFLKGGIPANFGKRK